MLHDDIFQTETGISEKVLIIGFFLFLFLLFLLTALLHDTRVNGRICCCGGLLYSFFVFLLFLLLTFYLGNWFWFIFNFHLLFLFLFLLFLFLFAAFYFFHFNFLSGRLLIIITLVDTSLFGNGNISRSFVLNNLALGFILVELGTLLCCS